MESDFATTLVHKWNARQGTKQKQGFCPHNNINTSSENVESSARFYSSTETCYVLRIGAVQTRKTCAYSSFGCFLVFLLHREIFRIQLLHHPLHPRDCHGDNKGHDYNCHEEHTCTLRVEATCIVRVSVHISQGSLCDMRAETH